MWRINIFRPVAWLTAIGTLAVTAILIVIQSRTILEMRQEITSLHAEIEQWVEQASNTEAVTNARLEADAPKATPEEPSQELLRLRGEVGVLRQQLTELQERFPGSLSGDELPDLEALRREIKKESMRLKLISDALPKVSPLDRAQIMLATGINDPLLNTLFEQLGIADQRHRRLAREGGDDDDDVQDAGKWIDDLNVTIDRRCQGVLMGLEQRVSSMKLIAERLEADLQNSASGFR